MLCLALALPPGARAAEPAQVSADELERLVLALQDDRARAKLVDDLRALIAVQRGAEKEKPAAAALFGQLSQQIDAFSGEILAGASMLVDAPRLFGWAREQMFNDAARILLADAAVAFGVIFGSAAIAEWIVRAILARLLRRLPVRRSDTPLVRASFTLLGLVLALVPIIAFACAAYAMLSLTLDPFTRTQNHLVDIG